MPTRAREGTGRARVPRDFNISIESVDPEELAKDAGSENRPALSNRDRQERDSGRKDNKAIGKKIGKRTGIEVPERVSTDSSGLENVNNFFEAAGKSQRRQPSPKPSLQPRTLPASTTKVHPKEATSKILGKEGSGRKMSPQVPLAIESPAKPVHSVHSIRPQEEAVHMETEVDNHVPGGPGKIPQRAARLRPQRGTALRFGKRFPHKTTWQSKAQEQQSPAPTSSTASASLLSKRTKKSSEPREKPLSSPVQEEAEEPLISPRKPTPGLETARQDDDAESPFLFDDGPGADFEDDDQAESSSLVSGTSTHTKAKTLAEAAGLNSDEDDGLMKTALSKQLASIGKDEMESNASSDEEDEDDDEEEQIPMSGGEEIETVADGKLDTADVSESSSSSDEDEDVPAAKLPRKNKQDEAAEEDGDGEEEEEAKDDDDDLESEGKYSVHGDSSDDDEEDDEEEFLQKYRGPKDRKKGYRIKPLPRDPNEATAGVRRSKRTRYPPLAAYKGERLVYERVFNRRGHIVDEVVLAGKPSFMKTPTPVKMPGDRTMTQSAGGRKRARRARHEDMPPPKMPKGLRFADNETEIDDGQAKVLVVGDFNDVFFEKLPTQEDDSDSDVDFAEGGSLFKSGEDSTGYVTLPASSSKKSQDTGADYKSFFHVLQCQPDALTLTMSGHTWKLREKMTFWVPPNIEYSLKNYSEAVEAQLAFVLVKR